MRRKKFFAAALAAAACCLLGAPAASGESVVELFQKAKQQVKAGSYDEALKTLDALDAATAAAGHEAERKQVEPPLAFYRGVSFAALGRKDEARASFQKYLGFAPNASIDASMYPKKAVASFEEARKELGSPAGAGESTAASIDGSYASFRPNVAAKPETPNEAWGDGPVKFLMTPEEKREWAKASDAVSRSEFVTKFWASRDPKPETPDNEFRQEFERRVAYADATFTQGEVRGSMTDRGMVFVLLGPPTYVGRKPLGTGDDTSDAAGMSTGSSRDAQSAIAAANASTASGKTSGGRQAQIADRATGSRITDSAANWREVWHYRRERLPAGVPYQQVDFDFITRKGYGENVLQRDSNALNTLEAARKGRKG
ncbi:MAG TPA: GWxTD domain-containing protein [Thermoanaerobaculia bacterium]|nr:GWxTD domain-containing protein [Thermoanaerobaculia bacterium]